MRCIFPAGPALTRIAYSDDIGTTIKIEDEPEDEAEKEEETTEAPDDDRRVLPLKLVPAPSYTKDPIRSIAVYSTGWGALNARYKSTLEDMKDSANEELLRRYATLPEVDLFSGNKNVHRRT